MRQKILTAAAAFVIGGIVTGAVLTHAQPAQPGPPPGPGMDGPPPRHSWMGWHHRPGLGGAGGPMEGMRAFALIYRQQDRALSPADVQKIAEAFLLWNGNHTWKVTDVTPTAGGPVGFSLATADGGVVAKFTMDPHTARVQRVE